MLNKFSHIPCVENFHFIYLMAYWWGLSKLAHNFVNLNITFLKNDLSSNLHFRTMPNGCFVCPFGMHGNTNFVPFKLKASHGY
jgi:hypothetical protein